MPEQPFKSSRFLIWDKPMAYPKFDLITRDTDPGPVFDMNVDLSSYDGSVYIKVEHIVEMARSVGMLTKAEADRLRAENDELRRQINKLPKAQEELKDGLDDLTARFYASINTISDSTGDNSDDSAQNDRESQTAESDAIKPFSF